MAAKKWEDVQIKKVDSKNSLAVDYDRYTRQKVSRKKKYRAGLLLACKQKNKSKTPKHGGIQRYCMLCKNSGMPERKFMLHSAETCFGKRSYEESLNKGMGGIMGNSDADFKQFSKAKKSYKRNLKDLKKQNMIIYSMYKRTRYRRWLNNTKNILSKVFKKYESYSISSYRSYSNSFLSSNIE